MQNEGYRILIVDDNEDIHDLIRSILETVAAPHKSSHVELDQVIGPSPDAKPDSRKKILHFSVDSALQGIDAVNLVSRAATEGRPYDLVFMDVRMPPGIDGIKALAMIWQKHQDIAAIICTAYADHTWNDIQKIFSHPSNLRYLPKPFRMEDLEKFIHELLAG